MIRFKRAAAFVMSALIALTSLFGCSDTDVISENGGVNSEPKNEISVVRQSSSREEYNDVKLYALKELTTSSPDGGISAYFWQDEAGGLYYSVVCHGKEAILPSRLGITLSGCDFSTGIESITSYDRADEIDDEYDTALTVSLEGVSCRDHCMQRQVFLKKGDASLTLSIRVYDDGFAYRYEDVNSGVGNGSVFVINETSEINLPEDTVTFAGGYSATYEYDYIERSYDELVNHSGVFNTPVTAYTGDSWLLFSESDVYAEDISYVKSVLETSSGSAALHWQFGFDRDPANEVTDELASPGHIRIEEVRTQNSFTTPWRAAIITDELGELVLSDVIDSLCPPMDEKLFESTDWIKPGKVSWSWWSGGDQSNYDVQVDHVDFSSENGWEYCCLDAGWPAFEDRIAELCDYADDKGVGIILWVNYLNLKTPEEIEELFSKWHDWGVVGVKTDYFESDDIDVLEVMRNCAEIGAKYELMIYYHGCINPCGETRTYPNIMSSEAVLGEEFRKWSTSPTPKNCLMYPFTRNVTGSMDYTPSCIAISKTGESAGFSLAKAIVYESALQHFASSAYSFPYYLGLPLLSRMPTAWTQSSLIDGYPGEHAVFMRSDGEDYYIGAMSLSERSYDISLDFLPDGEYTAYIYSDDESRDLVLTTSKVTNKDSLSLELLEIGGAAVLITKGELDTSVEEPLNARKDGYTYYEMEDGKLSGSAVVSYSMMCSGEQKVGYVGNGGFNSVTASVTVDEAGEYELIVYFCSGESRSLDITVNSKDKYSMTGLISQGFDMPDSESITVSLDKGENTVKFSLDSGYAPDLDMLAVSDKPV